MFKALDLFKFKLSNWGYSRKNILHNIYFLLLEHQLVNLGCFFSLFRQECIKSSKFPVRLMINRPNAKKVGILFIKHAKFNQVRQVYCYNKQIQYRPSIYTLFVFCSCILSIASPIVCPPSMYRLSSVIHCLTYCQTSCTYYQTPSPFNKLSPFYMLSFPTS